MQFSEKLLSVTLSHSDDVAGWLLSAWNTLVTVCVCVCSPIRMILLRGREKSKDKLTRLFSPTFPPLDTSRISLTRKLAYKKVSAFLASLPPPPPRLNPIWQHIEYFHNAVLCSNQYASSFQSMSALVIHPPSQLPSTPPPSPLLSLLFPWENFAQSERVDGSFGYN